MFRFQCDQCFNAIQLSVFGWAHGGICWDFEIAGVKEFLLHLPAHKHLCQSHIVLHIVLLLGLLFTNHVNSNHYRLYLYNARRRDVTYLFE